MIAFSGRGGRGSSQGGPASKTVVKQPRSHGREGHSEGKEVILERTLSGGKLWRNVSELALEILIAGENRELEESSAIKARRAKRGSVSILESGSLSPTSASHDPLYPVQTPTS